MSAGNCNRGLEKVHIPQNEDEPGKTRDSMPHSPQIRRDFGYNLFLYQKKTILTFISGEKTIAAFDLNFFQIKWTNVGNNMSKAQSFRSIIAEMACD